MLNHRDDPNLKKGKKTLKSEELQGSNEYSVITLETVLEQRTKQTEQVSIKMFNNISAADAMNTKQASASSFLCAKKELHKLTSYI